MFEQKKHQILFLVTPHQHHHPPVPYCANAFSRPSDVVPHARLPTKMFLLITQTLSLAAPKTLIAAPTAAV